jgi:hypothetical protein
MKYRILTVVAAVTLATLAGASTANALWPANRYAAGRASQLPWHGGFYDPAWGQPVALVVPPNAESQTNWGWGVGNTRTMPIYHQFGRNYPGAPGGVALAPTPPWPSDTQQFGVYYVRGPWK